jgi:DNA polymerase III alpha subunit (gram-positive type)
MLKEFLNKQVTILFIDGGSISNGTIIELDDKFVKYESPLNLNIIPITSIKSITLHTEEKPKPIVRGFV